MTTTYRIRQPKAGEFDTFTMAELADAKFATELSKQPEHDWSRRFAILGEWYCQNSDCPCREVRIHAKWPEPELPTFNCPSCGCRLKFHGHMRTTTLIPVEL